MPPSLHDRSRKSSTASSKPAVSAATTTFFLTNEEDMQKRTSRTDTSSHSPPGNPTGPVSQAILAANDGSLRQRDTGRQDVRETDDGQILGVQHLHEALDAAFGNNPSNLPAAEIQGVSALSRNSSGRSMKSVGSDDSGHARRKRVRRTSSDRHQHSRNADEALLGTETPKHEPQSATSSPRRPQAPQSSTRLLRRLSTTATSTPLTPNLDSPLSRYNDSALPGTPKSLSLHSLRLSDNGSADHERDRDADSQAIESSDDENGGLHGSQHERMDSAPELVIPSITMPARRPFTERGKALGRLKIMVAGSAGVGKSGLVRAIVRGCEDIVHVDPVPVRISTAQGLRKRGPRLSVEELFASTKAYPSWWSDIEGSRVLRRRKSMGLGDTVLDRNVCFVDTRDCRGADANVAMLMYMKRLASMFCGRSARSESDTVAQLSGSGVPMVDVVLFVFGHGTITEEELSQFAALSTFTNVVPVIGKSDLLSDSEVPRLRCSILEQLVERDLYPFLFGRLSSELIQKYRQTVAGPPSHSTDDAGEVVTSSTDASNSTNTVPESSALAQDTRVNNSASTLENLNIPFAVSSAPGPDLETMDASLLMSPEYCPPPLPSDLDALISALFDPENVAWFRHSAARKLVAYQRDQALTAPMLPSSAAVDVRSRLAQGRCGSGDVEANGGRKPQRSSSAHFRALQKSARHWSEVAAADSTDSSQSIVDGRSVDVLDVATRVGGVLIGVLKVVGGMSAFGILAAVVAKTVFGVRGVEVVTLGEGWRWTVVMGEGRS